MGVSIRSSGLTHESWLLSVTHYCGDVNTVFSLQTLIQDASYLLNKTTLC